MARGKRSKPARRNSDVKRKAAPAPVKKSAPSSQARRAKVVARSKSAPRKKAPVKLSVSDRVKTLLQIHSPAKVAKALKVSASTLRRYRDGKGKPGDKKTEKRLVKESSKARKKILNQGKSKEQGFKTPKLRVPLVGKRQTRRDAMNADKRIQGNTIIYNVSRVGLGEIAELLSAYRDSRRRMVLFRVVYLLPAGKSDYNKVKYSKPKNSSTEWVDLLDPQFSGVDGILEFLQDIQRRGKLLHVVVTDKRR